MYFSKSLWTLTRVSSWHRFPSGNLQMLPGPGEVDLPPMHTCQPRPAPENLVICGNIGRCMKGWASMTPTAQPEPSSLLGATTLGVSTAAFPKDQSLLSSAGSFGTRVGGR